MIDFDKEIYHNGQYCGMQFSDDQSQAMNLYLFEGLKPGGHLEAMLAHDYERALYNADTHSRKVFWATARWIRDSAPALCHGSYDAINFWCKSKAHRDAYKIECEKKLVWETLQDI